MDGLARLLGDFFGTRYEIGEEIGSGGMARVYRARDLVGDRARSAVSDFNRALGMAGTASVVRS